MDHLNIISDRQQLRKLHKNGKTYVCAVNGQIYVLHVNLPGPGRWLCIATVDGLDVLTGKPGDCRGENGYVASYSLTIEGWRISHSHVAEFRFGEKETSYAEKSDAGDKANCGVIAIALYKEKDRQKSCLRGMGPVVQSCSAQPKGLSPQSKGLGTQWGQERESRVTDTEFEKATQEPFVIETIYYKTHDELRELGFSEAEISGCCSEPNPFPANTGFCTPPK